MKSFKQFVEDPCWPGYKQIGMKKKKGKKVPNCVPEEVIEESEYQGKKVKLNDPMRASDGKKKFYVCLLYTSDAADE